MTSPLSLPKTRYEADPPSLPPPLPPSPPTPALPHSPPSAAGPSSSAADVCSVNSPSALIIKAMLSDDDDDNDQDCLSEEGGRKGRRRKQNLILGGKSSVSSHRPTMQAQPSLQTILRQAQPLSTRTGQFHRQQEVKMQSIRGLLLASLSINLVCGLVMAAVTGATRRGEGRESSVEEKEGEDSSRNQTSLQNGSTPLPSPHSPPPLPSSPPHCRLRNRRPRLGLFDA